MVTLGQARYLAAIHQMRGCDRNMSKLAEVLSVSKPSVTNMINVFEEKGWVKKGPPLSLTAQGRALANEIMSRQSFFAGYFAKELGLMETEVYNDVLVLMCELSDTFIDALVCKIETKEAQKVLAQYKDNVYLTSFNGILPDGVYDYSFRILKKNETKLSMGDKGFLHPARLVVTGGIGVLRLRAVPVKHKAIQGDLLKGRLSRLFFWNGEVYCEVREENGVYSFPVMAMKWGHDEELDTDYGILEIKVHASVGTFHMPDSPADLAIYLE